MHILMFCNHIINGCGFEPVIKSVFGSIEVIDDAKFEVFYCVVGLFDTAQVAKRIRLLVVV